MFLLYMIMGAAIVFTCQMYDKDTLLVYIWPVQIYVDVTGYT